MQTGNTMKTRDNLFFNIGLICLFFFFTGTTSVFGSITGSAHDFSSQGWSGGRICQVCHTPHTADSSAIDAPLWNHEITTSTFTMYSSPSMIIQPESQPQGVTKLCLSCHDGTVAIDSFAGNWGSTYISGDANLDTDLSDDHPVSIRWEHQNQTPSCTNCHFTHGQMFSSDLPFFNGFVECATCHDVHNTIALPKLLRKPLQQSELCFYCHGK